MSFQDIKGQDRAVLFFKKALSSNNISHASLFFGPEGVGKTLLAHMLSKALNCLDPEGGCCDKCASCVKIENKNHPDVKWIEAVDTKDTISIEQIRELRRQISLKPYEGRTKVFIIQDSHLMTQEAANCLLKTLEEPPDNSVIILITSKAEEILPTVKSRCKQIKFEPLELKIKVELAQKAGFLKEEALFLSKLANSGVSLVSDLKEGKIFDYRNKVLDEFGFGSGLLDEKSFIFSESRERMKFIISILESWFRDILVLKSAADESVVINSDRVRELKELRHKLGFSELEDVLKAVENTHFYIERNVGPKIAFNSLKMKIAEIGKRIA